MGNALWDLFLRLNRLCPCQFELPLYCGVLARGRRDHPCSNIQLFSGEFVACTYARLLVKDLANVLAVVIDTHASAASRIVTVRS